MFDFTAQYQVLFIYLVCRFLLFTGMFNPFTQNVNINTTGFKSFMLLLAYYLSHLFLFLCCVLFRLWATACDLCCQGLKIFSYISSSFCHCCFYRQRITPISIIHHNQNGSAFLFVLKFNSKSSTFPMTKYPIIFGLLSQEEMCFTFWVISCRSTCGKEHVDYGRLWRKRPWGKPGQRSEQAMHLESQFQASVQPQINRHMFLSYLT